MALYTLMQPSDQIFTTPLKLSLINNFANPSWSGRLPLHGSYWVWKFEDHAYRISTVLSRNETNFYCEWIFWHRYLSKVSRGNSEYRVILNTSHTMLCYFSSINSCTPVLHLQVGLEGSFDRSFSCCCRSSLHIVRLQNVQSVKNLLGRLSPQTLQYSSNFATFWCQNSFTLSSIY